MEILFSEKQSAGFIVTGYKERVVSIGYRWKRKVMVLLSRRKGVFAIIILVLSTAIDKKGMFCDAI